MTEPFQLPRLSRDPLTDELIRDVAVLTEEHMCWGHECGNGVTTHQDAIAHVHAKGISEAQLRAHLNEPTSAGGHGLSAAGASARAAMFKVHLSEVHVDHHAMNPHLFKGGGNGSGHDPSVGDHRTVTDTRDHLFAAHNVPKAAIGGLPHDALKAIHGSMSKHDPNWQKGYDHGAKVLAAANKAADTRAVNNAKRAGVTASEIRHDLRGDK